VSGEICVIVDGVTEGAAATAFTSNWSEVSVCEVFGD
jgi:hypothetical protein